MLRLLGLLFMVSLPVVAAKVPKQEFELVKDLKKSYDFAIAPANETNEPILIKALLDILVVYDLELKKSHLVTRAKLRLDWQDTRLIWDPSNYSNIQKTYSMSPFAWVPKIVICNLEKQSKNFDDEFYGVAVRHDGSVTFSESIVLRTVCDIDIYMYPFDKQKCEIWLCPLIDDDNYMAFDSFKVELHPFYNNSQWDLKLGATDNNVKRKSQVKATLYLTRNASFDSLIIILPAFILSILTLCTFLLPAESGEKVSLATAVFLSNVVYLVEMHESLDTKSKRPALMIMYLIALTSLSGFGTIGAIIVCKVQISETENDDANQKEENGYCGSCFKTRTNSISVVSEEHDTKFELDKIPQHEMKKKKKKKKCRGHRKLDKIFLAIGCIMFLIFAIIFGHFFKKG